ncbi:response regulator transcription factor [Nesterenkonia populi]|uniref:response regulator transcription factor n=1 Tax=Nesterenkonia populi TaxID=1591087 RepID=UPI001478A050|nr:LuxR C-terminal-related transcriptional regulator [Nesterenkonia populi]
MVNDSHEVTASLKEAENVVPADLPPREEETLALVAKGLSNSEIANAMVITERTAKAHVGSLCRKFLVRDRTQLVIRAAELGLVELELSE